MKKNIKFLILGIVCLAFYLVIFQTTNFHIPCLIHKITGLYCPGCGITRMIISLIKLDFYQAFRYNPLLFIFSPFGLILFIEYLYSTSKRSRPFIERIDKKVWYVLIIVLIFYGIIRNIYLPLAPTEVV